MTRKQLYPKRLNANMSRIDSFTRHQQINRNIDIDFSIYFGSSFAFAPDRCRHFKEESDPPASKIRNSHPFTADDFGIGRRPLLFFQFALAD